MMKARVAAGVLWSSDLDLEPELCCAPRSTLDPVPEEEDEEEEEEPEEEPEEEVAWLGPPKELHVGGSWGWGSWEKKDEKERETPSQHKMQVQRFGDGAVRDVRGVRVAGARAGARSLRVPVPVWEGSLGWPQEQSTRARVDLAQP